MYKVVTYTRSDLFAKVWSTPMLQLAKEIGVSDVAIGKACRRAGIPVPGRGYWAKDAEQRHKPELSESASPSRDTIKFQVLDVALIGQPKTKAPPVPKPQQNPIKVPQSLQNPHPLVAATLDAAKKRTVDHGRLVLDSKSLDIRVSPDSIGRALRLMNALIKASEKGGYTWAISGEGNTTVAWQGESMRVDLKERLVRREKPRVPAPAPKRRGAWAPYVPSWPTYEWIATSELTLHVDEYITSGAQRKWQDTKRTRLEDKLSDILAGLPLIAAGIKAVRDVREARDRAYAEQARKAADHAKRQEALRLARARLVSSMQCWEQASRIRQFCQAIEGHSAGLPTEEAREIDKWVEWVRLQADLLDPLKQGLPKVRPWEVKVPELFDGYYSPEKLPEDWWSAATTRQSAHQPATHIVQFENL